jgi:DnaJ-domain-containing protein 1
MSRPLIQRRIDELETMFESQQTNPDVLRLLEVELSFRSVPRATTLLANVRRTLSGGVVLPSAQQKELFDNKAPASIPVPLLKDPPKPAVSSLHPMPLEEAFKVLKITSGAPWEAVEASRRQAVDRSHPNKLAGLSEDKRGILREEARRVNAAYLAVFSERKA